jgi:aerobic carbon-monoxide dehydrogenase medium subunit
VVDLDEEVRFVYPAAFEYSAPSSLDEALDALARVGDDGRVLAGGQSLIPMMKLRLAAPGHLVDINGLRELAYIRQVPANGHSGYLAIGALARHADVVAATRGNAVEVNHTVAAAAPWVADPLVRNRGTVCGSIAHCDPEGDWNSVMLAVGATVVARSASGGERTIPHTDFVVDFFTNALRPGEMVTEVRVPGYSGPAGGTYLKLERKIGDYATVGVATHLVLGASGAIAEAGIALTAVAGRNLKVPAAEAVLIGQVPGAAVFAEAADVASRACEPDSDVRGPAEYKRAVVREYVKRALATAARQAGGQPTAAA